MNRLTPAEQIQELVDDLTPVTPIARVGRVTAQWVVGSSAFVVIAMLALGPLREGCLGELIAHPRFLTETLLMALVPIFASVTALECAVPGGTKARFFAGATLALVAGWCAAVTYSYLVEPSLPLSMAGKREYCFYETLVLSLVPIGLALAAIRRRFALDRLRAAVFAGLAGAAIPAVIMQIACMVTPSHVLTHHAFPVLLLALATAGLAGAVLPRR